MRRHRSGEHVANVPGKLGSRVRLFDTGHNRNTDTRAAHSVAVLDVRMGVLAADGQLEAPDERPRTSTSAGHRYAGFFRL
jgi:hypothetical protein